METNGATERTRLLGDVVLALAGGIGGVAGSYAVIGGRPGFVVAPVADGVTALTPDAVVTWAILTLGSLGETLGFVLAVVLSVLGFAFLVGATRRVVEGKRDTERTTADQRSTDSARQAARIGAAVAVTVGVATLVVTGVALSAVGAGVGAAIASLLGFVSVGRETPNRRGFLKLVTSAVAVAGVGAVLGSGRRSSTTGTSGDAGSSSMEDPAVTDLLRTAAMRSLDVGDLEGLVSESFYAVDISSVDPDTAPEGWTLSVTGAVGEEREYSYADLLDLPAEHRFVSLRCVGDSLNGTKMDTALWTGVPIERLVGDLPDECCVMLRAADGYFVGFPMAALRTGFIAYRMNGEPLPRRHGQPVRALIPGHWGEVNVKWLTELEVLDEPMDGYWEKRGWHGTGPVGTVAKLHSVSKTDDGRIRVGGHTYAGTRGIDRVEVSTDGGETWVEAELSEQLPGAVDATTGESLRETAEDAWQMWRYSYEATDSHEVVVRAVDGTGATQPEAKANPFPRGPSGWVSQTVNPRSI